MDNVVNIDDIIMKKDKTNFLQKFFLAFFIMCSIFIIGYKLLPNKTRNELEILYYKIKLEIYGVNITSDDTIENIFKKNQNTKIQSDNYKSIIINTYFGENEFEKLYDYCQMSENSPKIYCLENEPHFKTIKQKRMLFMDKKNEFSEEDIQIINEIDNLINN
ncbi:MAG: hypothetical protein PHE25_03595 [Candidatus Gracilibacteria bacterium]|nr:hypothetical protein [Candidatus Gracilibacteria bacterium]